MTNTLSVSSIIVRSWSNQASKAVGGRAILAFLCGFVALVALVFGYLVTKEFIYPTFGAFSADKAAVVVLTGLILTNVSVMVSMMLSVFLMLSPSQTALDNLLSTMPVRTNQRVMGYFLPLVVTTTMTIAVMFSPVFVSLLYGTNLSALGTVWATFALASHLLYVVLLNLVFYLVTFTILTRVVAADQTFSRMAAALLMSASSLVTFAIALWKTDYFRGVAPLHHLNAHTVMIRGAIGSKVPSPIFYIATAAFAVAILLLLWMFLVRISMLSAPFEKPRKQVWLRRLPFGSYSLLVFLSQETKQAVRHPENFLFAAFFALLSSGLVLSSFLADFEFDRYVVGLPLIIWLSCSLFAHNSYGRTLPAHWLVQSVPSKRSVWLAAKLVSNCAFCGSLAALLFLVYSPVSEQTTVYAFLTTLPYGLMLVLALTLAGVVLPYSESYPFSTALSALFVSIAALPLSYALQRLFSVVPERLTSIVALLVAAVFVLLIYCVDRWRTSSDGDAG